MQDNPLRASDMRLHNQKLVLSRIHAASMNGISQSEIVQETGLKAPTIFRIFTSLEEHGLIEPIVSGDDIPSQKKGRRPVSYRVCRDALYSIGVEFWAAYVSVGVFDFLGDRVYSSMEALASDIDAISVMDIIVKMVHESIERINVPLEKILGIGIAAPGQVDLKNKVVMYYPRIRGLKNFSIVKILEERLHIPIILHNNCSAIAYSEYKYGNIETEGSLFTFLLRSGVNGAFVTNGEIYTTSRETTLETGHIPINFDGPSCSCGSRGCLQAYLLDLEPGFERSRMALFESLDGQLQAEDQKAHRTIERAAGYLTIAMRSIIRFLAPKTFLFVGSSLVVAESLANEIRKLFNEPDAFDADIPMIYADAYDPILAQRGASDLVLASYFS